MARLLHSSLEVLEGRIAPAAVFTTFTDTDGDTVKISSTKGTLQDLTSAVTVVAGHLDSISLGNVFKGASISITVTALGANSDGLVDVGAFSSTAALKSVVIKGNLGKILASDIGSVTLDALGGRGNTTGAADFESSMFNVGTLKIFKNLDQSHLILNTAKSVVIGGSLVGGQADFSGNLSIQRESGSVKIGGSLAGGGGQYSGSLALYSSFIAGAQKSGSVVINGGIQGGSAPNSGQLTGINVDSIFVGGSISGNIGGGSGSILVRSVTKSLTVGGNITGSIGFNSGIIQLSSDFKSNGTLTVLGNVTGFAASTGYISVAGKLKSATIMGTLTGGVGTESGSLLLAQTDTVFLGGDLLGGGNESRAGVVEITGLSKTITIGGSIVGGSSNDSGRLRFVYAKTLTIGGNVTGNVATDAGSIFGSVVGSVFIGGDVKNVGIGFGSSDTPATTKLVAKSIAIGGSVTGSYFEFGTKTRSDIQVGTFTVSGDWEQSDLLVGALNAGADGTPNTADDNMSFGDSHDVLAPAASSFLPTIDSIVIEGTIRGDNSGTHYGFVAGKIGSFRAGSVNVPLLAGDSNDLRDIGGTSVSIHEIGGNTAAPNPTLPANIVTFTDTDGDIVKVTSSKGSKDQLTAALGLTNGQLTKLDLTNPIFSGANISISVIQLGSQGNGTVDVGFIDATGSKLGSVLVKGDLGKIVAGTDDKKPAIGALTVNSLGARGTSTGAPDISSALIGGAGAVKVLGDVLGTLDIGGKLASLTVYGDIVGGAAQGSGSISVGGAASAVTIGGSIKGSVLGSAYLDFMNTGAIKIGGSLLGGTGFGSGGISFASASSLTVGGSLIGGTGAGATIKGQTVGNVTIGGSITGGGSGSGLVAMSEKGGIVKLSGSITGGADDSGYLAVKTFKSVSVQGAITGGDAAPSGFLGVQNGGSIFVGGRVQGASGANGGPGGIFGAKVGAVTLYGSLFAGTSGSGGTLHVDSATSVKILGSVAGGYVPPTGNIGATVSIGTLDISGDVNGALVVIGGADAKGGSTVAKSVHVGGSVLLSTFSFGSFARKDVAVGTFAVDGNWTGSNLLVGTANLGADDAPGGNGVNADNLNFGDTHDSFANASNSTKVGAIASIIIEGRIVGTSGVATDHFGFVAGQIGAFRAGSVNLPLTKGPGNDTGIPIGIAGDLTVKEVPGV